MFFKKIAKKLHNYLKILSQSGILTTLIILRSVSVECKYTVLVRNFFTIVILTTCRKHPFWILLHPLKLLKLNWLKFKTLASGFMWIVQLVITEIPKNELRELVARNGFGRFRIEKTENSIECLANYFRWISRFFYWSFKRAARYGHLINVWLSGTFILALIGIGAGLRWSSLSPLGGAIAGGLGVCLGIYTAANVSGGHVNPAVTTAFWIQGRLGSNFISNTLMMLIYFAAQEKSYYTVNF